jgi:arabinofuranosyltransferase
MAGAYPSELRHFKILALVLIAASSLSSLALIEDAFIPLRVVKQFFDGNGLVWNMGERVQVSTSLPWQILLLPLGLTDPVKGLAALVFFLSLMAFFITMKMVRDFPTLVVVTASWLFSTATKLYLVSGLETPLVAILLCLCVFYWKRNPWAWAFFVGCLPATRHDLIMVAVPLAVAGSGTLMKNPRSLYLLIFPFFVNVVFSVFYFGSPFPNTAYAKLGANIPFPEIADAGSEYIIRSFQLDPSLWILAIAAVWILWRADRSLGIAILAGGAFSVFYAWAVAGDYMLGRFLIPMAILSISCLAKYSITIRESSVITSLLLFGFFLTHIRGDGPASDHRFLKPQDLPSIPLGKLFSEEPFADLEWAEIGRRLQPHDRTLQGSIGIMGYFSHNSHHIKDFLALADPMLARLPSPYKLDWRPGHFDRIIPEGSWDWDTRGEVSSFKDPELTDLARLLKSAHKDSLFSRKRFSSIVSLLFWKPSGRLLFENTYPNAINLRQRGQKILPGQYGVIRGTGVIDIRGRFVLDRVKNGRRMERKFLGGEGSTNGPWNLFYISSEDSDHVIIASDSNGFTFEGFTPSAGPPVNLRIQGGEGDSVEQHSWMTINKGSFIYGPTLVKFPAGVDGGSYHIKFYPDNRHTIEADSLMGVQKIQNGGVITISGNEMLLRSQNRIPLEYISLIPLEN